MNMYFHIFVLFFSLNNKFKAKKRVGEKFTGKNYIVPKAIAKFETLMLGDGIYECYHRIVLLFPATSFFFSVA